MIYDIIVPLRSLIWMQSSSLKFVMGALTELLCEALRMREGKQNNYLDSILISYEFKSNENSIIPNADIAGVVATWNHQGLNIPGIVYSTEKDIDERIEKNFISHFFIINLFPQNIRLKGELYFSSKFETFKNKTIFEILHMF